nr:Chain A, Gallinacin-11 [Gallus gallus]
LPRDTSRCVGYHGYCIRSKVCPKPFAAFGTCSWRQKTCCV